MPLGTSPSDIADKICPCPDAVSRFGIGCDVVTSEVVPSLCFDTVIPTVSTNPQQSFVQFSAQVCPLPSAFPVVDGEPVGYKFDKPPFRVALDEKARQWIDNGVQDVDDVVPSLQRDCNTLLNSGGFPGCSLSAKQGGACTWNTVVVGAKDGKGFQNCGGNFQLDTGFLNVSCAIAASFCLRTGFDYTYKAACCKQSLETDFGLTESVYVTNTFVSDPGIRLGNMTPDQTFIQTLSSVSFNPYELYCDPQWCSQSPSCDPIFFDLCRWSTTTVGTSTIHACLAPTGKCRDWYSYSVLTPTPETALTVGGHDWLLIDRLMKDYCLFSATSNSDTLSCECIGYGRRSVDQPASMVYFTSCSELGISTNCPEGVVPVTPIDGVPLVTISGTPRVLSDPVCSNIACLSARADGSKFLTSGALLRALACPQDVCLLAVMNSKFNIGNIGTGTRYISGNSQFCGETSFSANTPDYRLVDAPTIWFYTNVGKSITNPNQVSILRIENVSNDENTNMNWSISWNGAPSGGLPPWLTFQGRTSGIDVYPGNAVSVQWSLGEVTRGNLYFDLSLSVFMLGTQGTTLSQQSLTLNFAVTDIDKPFTPLPSGGDTDPNGIPLLVREQLSPGAIAMIVLIVILLLIAFYAFVEALRTGNMINKARFWSSTSL